MQIAEHQDGRCRCVHWTALDRGSDDLSQRIDSFLTSSITRIAEEYVADPVEWLEVNLWLDSGRLIVFPAHDGPNGNRGERIYFELQSTYVENEYARICNQDSESERKTCWESLTNQIWSCVGASLSTGEASRHLAEARKVHRLRLAAFDYDFGEGSFHLTDLDKEAEGEMLKELVNSKLK